MSETSDWTRRVDQMTGASVHEQLRTVVRDAEDMLQKFTTSAYEQGGLLLDAQKELEASVAQKIDQVSSEIRKDIASIEQAPSASVDLDPLRKDVFASMAAFGEELDAETKKIREEIASRMEEMGARLATMEDAQRALRSRVEAALTSADERFAMVLAQLERNVGMEERAAARMVDMLASAFAELRTPPAIAAAS